MSAVNQRKSCMRFQCPPYSGWEGCLLSQPAIQGRYRTRCEEKQPTSQALLATKQRRAKTVAGGGTWTAGPSAGEQSNDGMTKYAITFSNMQNMWNEKYAKYVAYANNMKNNMSIICNKICRIICRICNEICQIICIICTILCIKICNKICRKYAENM